MMSKHHSDPIGNLLASVNAEFLDGFPEFIQSDGLRVERLMLELVRPDPVQPRRVLPEYLHFAFHQGQLTPTQALREFIVSVQRVARVRLQPFNSLMELLPSGEDEKDDKPAPHLTPEEKLLRDLVLLAVTVHSDGQVNPLTVVEVPNGTGQQYRIETGERRYWATWLLREFLPELEGDGLIPCIIIPQQRASIFRQARENTARSGLTAVALARQAALLLLNAHGYEIPAYAVGNDFYRQALDLDLRGKREYTEAILSAMGGIQRSQFSLIKSLLRLSDEALELADRHQIEEKRLRPVVNVPAEYHAEIVQQIIDFKMTARQVQELCEGDPGSDDEDDESITPSAMKIAKAARATQHTPAQDMAKALLKLEGDVGLARARLKAMRRYFGDVERYLTED
ncbi:MAG: ParB N-terminal domain-containing protein [Anaerolineae bacterium]|nr:ParB N-terminal domain-containing protein [Anaerolineae bacterium]